jgi:hypothetical protein
MEYLIIFGHQRVANELRSELHLLTALQNFSYQDNGRDVGGPIREKALFLASLILSPS